jgi:hypothetical protein
MMFDCPKPMPDHVPPSSITSLRICYTFVRCAVAGAVVATEAVVGLS